MSDPALQNEGFIWSARGSLIAHLADPHHPFLTLCGVEAEYLARADVLAQPALRCHRCADRLKEVEP